MITEDTYEVPFPSREEVENGDFDYLKNGSCSSFWRQRFGLLIDENGELVPNENLKQLWDEQENKK